MERARRILVGREGQTKLLEGIEVLENTVQHLYGSCSGREEESFLAKIDLLHPIQNMGCALVKKAMAKVTSQFHDGSFLTLFLTSHLARHLDCNKIALEKAVAHLFSHISLIPLPTKTSFSEIFSKAPEEFAIGKKNGVHHAICLDPSLLLFTSCSELSDLRVIVFDGVMEQQGELLALLEGKITPFLLIAEDVQKDALASLKLNAMQGLLSCMILKFPRELPHRNALISSLQAGSKQINALFQQGKLILESGSFIPPLPYMKKVAFLTLSESEIPLFESEFTTWKNGAKSGLTISAPSALFHAAQKIDLSQEKEEETSPIALIKNLAMIPLMTLIENANLDFESITNEIKSKGEHFGFNFQTKQVTNLVKDGMIAPMELMITAFHQAIEAAALLRACEIVIDYN